MLVPAGVRSTQLEPFQVQVSSKRELAPMPPNITRPSFAWSYATAAPLLAAGYAAGRGSGVRSRQLEEPGSHSQVSSRTTDPFAPPNMTSLLRIASNATA